MDMTPLPRDVARELRRALLALARAEEELALKDAAATPYWKPCPTSVEAHRVAATALRANADRFEYWKYDPVTRDAS